MRAVIEIVVGSRDATPLTRDATPLTRKLIENKGISCDNLATNLVTFLRHILRQSCDIDIIVMEDRQCLSQNYQLLTK